MSRAKERRDLTKKRSERSSKSAATTIRGSILLRGEHFSLQNIIHSVLTWCEFRKTLRIWGTLSFNVYRFIYSRDSLLTLFPTPGPGATLTNQTHSSPLTNKPLVGWLTKRRRRGRSYRSAGRSLERALVSQRSHSRDAGGGRALQFGTQEE